MSSDFDDLLPPWLRGAHQPGDDDQDEDAARAGFGEEGDTSVEIPESPAEDGQLPIWLTDSGKQTGSLIHQTGELSTEFLEAADALPSSSRIDLTYDEWLRIQQAANRPRSLEEEIPDLLEDAAPVSPFLEGSVALPDTGELPDWFLGMEELDETEAPDWYVNSQPRASSPPVESGEPAAFEFETPLVTPDLFASLGDTGAPVNTEPAHAEPVNGLDAFFAGISSQRQAAIESEVPPDLFEPLPDSASTWDKTPSSILEGYLEADSSIDADGEPESAYTPLESATSPDDELPSFGDFEPLGTMPAQPTPWASEPPAVPSSPALHAFDEPDLDDFFEQPVEKPQPAPRIKRLTQQLSEPEPEDRVSDESLSWLNEINAIVGAAVNQPLTDDDDLQDTRFGFPGTGELGDAISSAQAAHGAQGETPDWLAQLQSVPEAAGEYAPTTSEALPANDAESPSQAPVIDFSNLDLSVSDTGLPRTGAIDTPEETYEGLFTDIGSRKNRPPDPEKHPQVDTRVLNDEPAMEPQSLAEPAAITLPDDLEDRVTEPTDEMDQALFGAVDIQAQNLEFTSDLPPQPLDAGHGQPIAVENGDSEVVDWSLLDTFNDTLAQTPPDVVQIDDYFALEELTDTFEAVDPDASDSEDLSWLQTVYFGDDQPDAPVSEDAVAAAGQPVDEPPPPPQAALDNDLFSDADLPLNQVHDSFYAAGVATTGELNELFNEIEPSEAADDYRPAGVATTGELNELFGAIDPPGMTDGDAVADLDRSADGSDLGAQDGAPARFVPTTGELNDLFAIGEQPVTFDDSPASPADILLGDAASRAETDVAARHAPTTSELNDLFDAVEQPAAEAEGDVSFEVLFGNLDIPVSRDEPARYAPTTGELNDLFDAVEQPTPEAESDLSFDSLLSDLNVAAQLDEPARFAPTTSELNALFDAIGSSAATEAEDEAALDALFGSADMTGLLSPQGDQPAQPEQRMLQDDDFDKLFADMDDESSGSEPESLPSTGALTGHDEHSAEAARSTPPDEGFDALFAELYDSAPDDDDMLPSTGALSGFEIPGEQQAQESAGDDDLEALFAAFEDEQRAVASTDTEALASDSDDDDAFFAALGLGDDTPPREDPSPPPAGDEPAEGPDLDFLEGFGLPERNEATVLSGAEHTSVWEATETTEGQAQADLPAVPAFAREDAQTNTRPQAESDWFTFDEAVDDFAPVSSQAAFEFEAEALKNAQDTKPALPDWLLEIQTGELFKTTEDVESSVSPPQDSPGFTAADIEQLDSFISALDAPDEILPSSGQLAAIPITSTDEIDLDKLFDAPLPELPPQQSPDMEALAPAEFLGELRVDEVSPSALARQMQDKPAQELSDRLQKLRIRTTDEFPSVPPTADDSQAEGALARVLPGVDDALAPAPAEAIFETSELVSGVQLSDDQRQHVALVREMVGTDDEAYQTRRENKLSAIDLTYNAPQFQTEDEEAAEPEAAQTPAATKRVPRRRTYRIDRLLLSVLLAVGISLPFFVPELRIGSLPSAEFAVNSDEQQAFTRIDSLQQYDLVLVALEYSPAAAGELDLLTETMIRHILLRGARPIFISGNAFGILRSQSFIDRINSDTAFLERIDQQVALEANVEYFVARFLPGSSVGLRAFSEATAALLMVDINGQTTGLNLESLSNVALVVLIADRAEDVRAYAEQIAPLAGRPLVVGVSYAASPLAQPYAAAEAAGGFLTGYEDAYTYAGLLDVVEAVERDVRPILPQAAVPEATDEPPPPSDVAAPAATAAPGTGTPQPPTPAPTPELIGIVISADGANLRSGPGTDFTRIIGMPRNTRVTVLRLNETGDWVNIRLEDGTEGWVSAGLIVISEATPAPAGAKKPGGRMLLRPFGEIRQDDGEDGAEATPTRSTRRTPTPRPTQPATVEVTSTAGPEPTATATAAAVTATPTPVAVQITDDPRALRWYAMNMGIVVSASIIAFGTLTGIVRSIFRRRARS
jgi:hypothetical protein